MIDDRWGLYWHMIPRMCEGLGYDEEGTWRLREEMRWKMRDEGGTFRFLALLWIGRFRGWGENSFPK